MLKQVIEAMAGAPAFQDPDLERIHREFWATVELRPGLLLSDHVDAAGLVALRAGLDWRTAEPELMSAVRALVDLAPRGRTVEDIRADGLELYTEGREEWDGLCRAQAAPALGLLAPRLDAPIALYWRRRSDGRAMVDTFVRK